MKLISITSALALAAMASTAQAQTVTNYWDFSTMGDDVGRVTGSAVGTPDLSVHATYGEAYPGSGPSLNSTLGGTGAGGGHVLADVHDGTNPTALNLGTGDFSFSYWAFDDTTDGDGRGARILDFMSGTTTGLQLGTNLANDYNLRLDDDQGGSTITNNTLPIQMPTDRWAPVAVTVDRTGQLVEIYFDGVSQGTVPLASATSAAFFPTQDMDIGAINGGTNVGGSQQSALDDLAFYDGLLSAADIAGLASGIVTPLDYLPTPGTPYCFGTTAQGNPCPCSNDNDATDPLGAGCAHDDSSAGTRLYASGEPSVTNDTLRLKVMRGPISDSVLFFQANNNTDGAGLFLGDGIRCAGGGPLRLKVTMSDATGFARMYPMLITVRSANLGHPITAGDTLYYQAWLRDAGGSPCGTESNTSNGYEITWLP